MKDLTIGVTFEYMQNYLPTKRYKIEETRKMVTVRDIVVHELDEKDFPVAINVTDFNILPHNWEDPMEPKYDTIECRWDGKNLYKEKRNQSGSDKGELVFPSADAFIEAVKHHSRTKARDYYVAPGKEYQDGKSVDTENDLDSRASRFSHLTEDGQIVDTSVSRETMELLFTKIIEDLTHGLDEDTKQIIKKLG